jgi:rare lipoprotein A
MTSIGGGETSWADVAVSVGMIDGPASSPVNVGTVLRLFTVVLVAAGAAACAQTSVVDNRSAAVAAGRQASPEPYRRASLVTKRHVVVAARRHTPFAAKKHLAETPKGSYGIASFYSHGTETASGEKFDARELTAAHRTLPFGTRLRVTNVATGKSVVVRVNDRGPFIPGRVVDVSHSAAESLGITGQGIAKVKLDVVHVARGGDTPRPPDQRGSDADQPGSASSPKP